MTTKETKNDLEYLVQEGTKAHLIGDFFKAKYYYLLALKIDNKQHRVWKLLCLCHHSLAEDQESQFCLKQSLRWMEKEPAPSQPKTVLKEKPSYHKKSFSRPDNEALTQDRKSTIH